MGPHGDEFPATKFLRRFCGLAIDKDQAGVDEFLHSRAREFRTVGGHEPVKPRPSVSTNRQKFTHLGLGFNRHGQIVAGALGEPGWTSSYALNLQAASVQRGLAANPCWLAAYVLTLFPLQEHPEGCRSRSAVVRSRDGRRS